MGLALAGIAVALVRRRWTLLALLPFQLALAATYVIFFAEPRYRLPLEMLAFPFVALALGEIAALGLALARLSRDGVIGVVRSLRALAPALVLVVLWRIVWPAVARRWPRAAGASSLGGDRGGVPATWRNRDAASALAADGAVFTDLAHRRGAERIAPARRRRRGARGVQVRLGGGAVGGGSYVVAMKVADEGAEPARLSLADEAFDLPPGGAEEIEVRLKHPGGPLELEVALAGAPGRFDLAY